jgi:hypothetical protein
MSRYVGFVIAFVFWSSGESAAQNQISLTRRLLTSDVASARIDLVVMNCGHGALRLARGFFAADAYRHIVEGVFESCAPTTERRRWRVVVEGVSDKRYQLLPVGAELPSKPD